MLEALAQGTSARRVQRVAPFALWLAVLSLCGLAVAGADISVESLQVGVVEGAVSLDRSTLGLDQGLIGDTVRVSALVRNDGTDAVGEFEVDFFFTETISGEHGRLGTQVVSGLIAGETKRPVIAFDTTALAPGVYAFSAEADPRAQLSETDLCDNSAPRLACGGDEAESSNRYALTLLRQGRHISQLTMSDPFPTCRMGRLDSSLTVSVTNVGTESLTGSDLAVYGYYRLGLTPPANEFKPLVTDAAGNAVQLSKIVSLGGPGKTGSIFITLNYDALTKLFAPSSVARDAGDVLGRPSPAQIRITVQPADGSGTPQDLFLPAQFELSQFYSTVDLWTFPERSACCSGTCADTTSVALAPAVAGGLVFHAARDASGDRLYVLKVTTGEVKGSWPAPAGKALAALAAAYDDATQIYRVYVGATDGRAYALEGVEKEEGDFLTSLWQSADSVVKGDTYFVLSADASKLIVGSEAGAYVVDTATGQTARKVQNRVVTSAPAYVEGSGDLWIAADEVVYRVPASGSECSFNVGERVTSDLVRNATGTAVFFGTETGIAYAVGSTCQKIDDAPLLRSVVGIAVTSDGDDAVLYLTSDIGEMARVEYDGRGFRSNTETSVRAYEPASVDDAPALLPTSRGDDALVVFVTGMKREGRVTRPILQGWDVDLKKYETVSVWSTSVPFLFKPEEDGATPAKLLRPVVDKDWFTLLVASTDGVLYAFDLSQFGE